MTTEFDLSRALDVRIANQNVTEIQIANQLVWEKKEGFFEGFSSGLGGWYGYSLSRPLTGGDSGPYARETGVGPFNEWEIGYADTVTPWNPGSQVTISWSQRASVASKSVQYSLVLFDGSSNVVASEGNFHLSTTSWTRYSTTLACSGTVAEVSLSFYHVGDVGGETLDIDSVTIR